MIFIELDVPSRICLALTCKFFARLSQFTDTKLSDRATDTHILHYSTRRILLLQLKYWMPKGLRLCWKCCKYTPSGPSGDGRSTIEWVEDRNGVPQEKFVPAPSWVKGHSSILLGLGRRIRSPVIAHKACVGNRTYLEEWFNTTPGT